MMVPKASRRTLSNYKKGMIIMFYYCFGCITRMNIIVEPPYYPDFDLIEHIWVEQLN